MINVNRKSILLLQLAKIKMSTVQHMSITIVDSVKIPRLTNGSLEKMEDTDAENHVVFVRYFRKAVDISHHRVTRIPNLTLTYSMFSDLTFDFRKTLL